MPSQISLISIKFGFGFELEILPNSIKYGGSYIILSNISIIDFISWKQFILRSIIRRLKTIEQGLIFVMSTLP